LATELPTVQFMGLLEPWQVGWMRRQRGVGEIRVFKGIDGVNAFPPIEFQEL
jgi:hypothetical protein